ncbi:MAG: hypothetical protein HUK22_08335 [Thermoguttaceae bacterium]|nr:hypothetical protein [Thermoguttaceae bacterium]
MRRNRREFLTTFGAATLGATFAPGSALGATEAENCLYAPGEYRKIDAKERVFHISVAVEMLEEYPELPKIWADAGITDAWLDVWVYGWFQYPFETFDKVLAQIKAAGIRPHLLAVPFCHGGGALDPRDPNFPNLPPAHWKTAKRWNGSENWGFSWHSPADVEGAEAIKTLYKRHGAFDYFLDDDFRFSSTPGEIGGCVCDECKAGFLKAAGLSENRWEETLDDLRNNADTPLLRAWVDYFCDRLKFCFDAYRAAVPEVDLGIMVMYMGAERGGIRLDAYRDALFRVGEGGFSDAWYSAVKFKTIELFSVLLHRRFATPGRSFSETTVYPAGTLSAENMASKLSISTIADVRNTCFMSGNRPIPPEHFSVLAPRMAREKSLHEKLLGQKPTGPFKHFYGKAARYLGGENAFSLFLALGVPFEVCDEIPADGWTFLSDADAAEMERGELTSPGSKCFARFAAASGRFAKLDEELDAMFAFRRSILPELRATGVPYVEEEVPVLLAWYPEAKAVYLWNLTEKNLTVHIRRGERTIALKLADRDSRLISDAEFV